MMAAPAVATSFDARTVAGTDGAPLDLRVVHDFAVDVILRAGVLLRMHTWQRAAATASSDRPTGGALGPTVVKDSQVDLVTKVDVEIEEFLRHEIHQAWPNHEIVAEESFGRNGDVKKRWTSGRGPTWFVDPLDGTLNATHLFPMHCISIGFACSHVSNGCVVHDDALVGVIYAPSMGATGTLWSGARGCGAYLSYPAALPADVTSIETVAHGCHLSDLHLATAASAPPPSPPSHTAVSARLSMVQRLPLIVQPLPADAPSGILFASEWGKDRRRGPDGRGNLGRKVSTMTNMAAQDYVKPTDTLPVGRYVHGVRSLGSSTLDLAFVAQGSIDVLWEGGCWEWDVCAGVALLLEAGGLLTDSNPPLKSSALWTSDSSGLPRAELGARRFLAVRACCGSSIESAADAQARVAREVWNRTDGLDYHRDGVHYAVESTGKEPEAKTVQEKGNEDRRPLLANTAKATSSVRGWQDPLRQRKRLTKEEAQALAATADGRCVDAHVQPDDAGNDTFGGRLLDEGKDPWAFNAWDHVEPPASYAAMVEDKLAVQRRTRLAPEQAAKFHSAPATYWNNFYTVHENRFFKDRRWLHLEFPELIAASKADAPPTRVLEVGCGAGNTVFPLLECNLNPQLELFACDYAPEAVQVVKSHALYASPPCGARCTASVWDLASRSEDGEACLPEGVEPHSLDVVVLIFVLSALHPDEWSRAVANVRRALKPGGLVLVRDYGRHDLPQVRFGKGRMLDDNFYVRGDGTRVYFFTPDEFLTMFNASPPAEAPHGEDDKDEVGSVAITAVNTASSSTCKQDFIALQLAIDRRMLLNRKEKKQMFRHWLQAKFRYMP